MANKLATIGRDLAEYREVASGELINYFQQRDTPIPLPAPPFPLPPSPLLLRFL